MDIFLKVSYFILPLVLAGVTNMLFVKLPVLNFLNTPLDNEKLYKDGKRIFGKNKTWKGFIGMIVFSSLYMGLFKLTYLHFSWAQKLSLIDYSTFNGWLMGALWGLGYVVFELPNSFIKRRMDIAPGKQANGFKGALFTFIDQCDSVIGCIIFSLFFYRPTFSEMVILFSIGTGMHYLINIILYFVGLKKQMG